MNDAIAFARFDTSIAPVTLAVDGAGRLVSLGFHGDGNDERELALLHRRGVELREDPGACSKARAALERYLAGERRELGLELDARGTEFQRAVWEALRRIPYGATASYAELARRIGRPSAVRAVARANATNPIAIAIPCHRVIGSDGSLTGYAGGIEVKRALLELEARGCARPRAGSLFEAPYRFEPARS